MTALLDFPITTAADARDPLSVASAVRSFTHTELMVALNASGAKLTRALGKDVDTLVSLAEIGAAGMGVDEVRTLAKRVDAVRYALVAALQADLPGDEAGAVYTRLLGGQRRSAACNTLAHALRDHFLPKGKPVTLRDIAFLP
jgi:hypothetical protein